MINDFSKDEVRMPFVLKYGIKLSYIDSDNPPRAPVRAIPADHFVYSALNFVKTTIINIIISAINVKSI